MWEQLCAPGAKEARKNGSTLDLTVVQAFPGQAYHDVSGREEDREASGEMSWATRTAAEHGMAWHVVGVGDWMRG